MNTMTTDFSVARIFIVENEPGTVSNLKAKLECAIPGVIVESAETVKDGQEILGAAYDNQCLFDAVIIDFKLPKDKSDPTEMGDFTLGFHHDLCPDTLFIHMTARPDDPDFQRVRPQPNTPTAARRLYFGKDEYEWAQRVVAACAKHILEKGIRFHSNRIRTKFDQLFNGFDDERRSYRAFARSGSGRCNRGRSLEFAVFCDDAGEHWNQLDEDLRRQLETALGHAEDEDGNHYLGVMLEKAPAVETSNSKVE